LLTSYPILTALTLKNFKKLCAFIERIEGIAYQQDGHNNLCCVHTNGMEKILFARLQVILKDSLKEIDPKL